MNVSTWERLTFEALVLRCAMIWLMTSLICATPIFAQNFDESDCQLVAPYLSIIDSVEQSAFEEVKRRTSPDGPVSRSWYDGECLAVTEYNMPSVLYSSLLYYKEKEQIAVTLVDPERSKGYKMGGWPDPDVKQFLGEYFSLNLPDSTCFAIASLIFTQLLHYNKEYIVIDSLAYQMYFEDVPCLQYPRIIWRQLSYELGELRGPHAEVLFSTLRRDVRMSGGYDHVVVSISIFLNHIEWSMIPLE